MEPNDHLEQSRRSAPVGMLSVSDSELIAALALPCTAPRRDSRKNNWMRRNLSLEQKQGYSSHSSAQQMRSKTPCTVSQMLAKGAL